MQVIAEISLYPLNRDYDAPILEFIDRLKEHSVLEISTGETSTLVRGPYDVVWKALGDECQKTLEGEDRAVFVMKLLNMNQ